MIKGLYSAASAMIAGMKRQTVISHNVSNMNTPGFKQLLISLDDYYETPVVSNGSEPKLPLTMVQSMYSTLGVNKRYYVGDLGLGVETTPEETDFTAGAMRMTEYPYDLAIEGEGFFRVETPQGERYTRDGRFILDVENQIVSVDGYYLLGTDGQPITIPEDAVDVNIGPDGLVTIDGEEIAQIDLVSFENPDEELVRDLPNTFLAEGEPGGEEVGRIHQGYLEGANVNVAELMTRMMAVARAYEAAHQMVQIQDSLLGRVISSLGRF